jgi:hypothetical protein
MDGDFVQVKARKRIVPERVFAKTRMCFYFEKNGRCRNGDQCPYAHSKEERVIPPCHYGPGCRFKDKCKFSHAEHTGDVSEKPPAATFPISDFPTLTNTEHEERVAVSMSFRDVCATVDGHKTLVIGDQGGITADDMVKEVKSIVASAPNTVFDLCFQ